MIKIRVIAKAPAPIDRLLLRSLEIILLERIVERCLKCVLGM